MTAKSSHVGFRNKAHRQSNPPSDVDLLKKVLKDGDQHQSENPHNPETGFSKVGGGGGGLRFDSSDKPIFVQCYYYHTGKEWPLPNTPILITHPVSV